MTETADPFGTLEPVHVQVPALAEELATLRRTVRSYVESAGGDAATADDLELVISELATNVIEHTTSTTISVTVERTPHDWLIDVADAGDQLVLSQVPELPPPSAPNGRGLFVARSLVDDLEIIESPTSRTIRCRTAAGTSQGLLRP